MPAYDDAATLGIEVAMETDETGTDCSTGNEVGGGTTDCDTTSRACGTATGAR